MLVSPPRAGARARRPLCGLTGWGAPRIHRGSFLVRSDVGEALPWTPSAQREERFARQAQQLTQSADRGAGGSGTVEGTAAPLARSAGDATPSTPPACSIDNDKAGASVTLLSNTTSSCVNHEKTLGIRICPPSASLTAAPLTCTRPRRRGCVGAQTNKAHVFVRNKM